MADLRIKPAAADLRLKRNSVFNLAGGVLPALAALATVPFIVRGLGPDSYGLLVLVTAIVGYFALLDINVTAGSTKYIAEHQARGDAQRVSQTVCLGALIYLGIGLVGALALYGAAGWLARVVFNVAPAQHALAESALQIAALGFLFGQLQSYLQSIPQALMRYDVTGRYEALFGLAIPLGTVALLQAGWGLIAVVWLRVALSGLNALLLAHSVHRLLPALRWARPDPETLRSMGSFSAYAFLSRIAALSYAHGDKLIIGALLGMQPLAVYAVASTVGNRVLGLMYRVSAVMFPAASALAASGDVLRLRLIYLKASRYVVYVNLSALLLIGVFAEPLLRHWVGADFATGGALVLQLVALGQFVDSLTNLPSLVNDGRGHPRITGLFAAVRALLGLALVYLLVQQLAIVGAAWGHLLSGLLMSAAFIAYVHGRTVPVALGDLVRQGWAAPMLGSAGVALLTALLYRASAGSLRDVLALVLLALLLLALYGWRQVLLADDRRALALWWRACFTRAA